MNNTQNQPELGLKSIKKVKNLPESDINLADVAQKVAQNWLSKTLQLQWISAQEFTQLVYDFAKQLKKRMQEGVLRPQITLRLKALDRQINRHLSYVKNYLIEEVGKGQAAVYYSQMGIERIGRAYKFSVDRNRRLASLEVLLQGLEERGYAEKTYGTAFWKPLHTEYAELLQQADNMDSAISQQVKLKNKTKAEVRKVLNALILLIRANYPDTYKAELRIWGFHKEKY